jgi:hypothetical protein
MKKQSDPFVDAAVDELQGLIRKQYPDAQFTVAPGEDPQGVYVTAIVDVDDLDEVFDVVVERLLQMQVEESLPVCVIPVHPISRILAELQTREPSWSRPLLPVG